MEVASGVHHAQPDDKITGKPRPNLPVQGPRFFLLSFAMTITERDVLDVRVLCEQKGKLSFGVMEVNVLELCGLLSGVELL